MCRCFCTWWFSTFLFRSYLNLVSYRIKIKFAADAHICWLTWSASWLSGSLYSIWVSSRAWNLQRCSESSVGWLTMLQRCRERTQSHMLQIFPFPCHFKTLCLIWGARHINILEQHTPQLINMTFICIILIPKQHIWCKKSLAGCSLKKSFQLWITHHTVYSAAGEACHTL